MHKTLQNQSLNHAQIYKHILISIYFNSKLRWTYRRARNMQRHGLSLAKLNFCVDAAETSSRREWASTHFRVSAFVLKGARGGREGGNVARYVHRRASWRAGCQLTRQAASDIFKHVGNEERPSLFFR